MQFNGSWQATAADAGSLVHLHYGVALQTWLGLTLWLLLLLSIGLFATGPSTGLLLFFAAPTVFFAGSMHLDIYLADSYLRRELGLTLYSG